MNTLTISQIFSNLSFYKDQYLNIIQSADLYFTEVEGAFVDLFPFKKQQLFLGDLLQLWFSEKWSDDAIQSHRIEEYLAAQDVKSYASKHVYIFAITGNAVTGVNTSRVCAQDSQNIEQLEVRSPLKYYVELVNCPRPDRSYSIRQSCA